MRNQLTEERRQMIARQVTEDREAAQQRQFQLQQLLDNQRLSTSERDFALAQLEEAKAIASGERDADLRRFHEEREMAKNERDFVIGEYQNYKSQMDLERQQELDIRNQTLNQIYGLQDVLTGVQSQLGIVPEIQHITEADIAREIERRTTQNISDVDRAATAVASVGEADLIRNGIDLSSTGAARRADIAGQLAAEYQTAARAYDDAMSYITGKSRLCLRMSAISLIGAVQFCVRLQTFMALALTCFKTGVSCPPLPMHIAWRVLCRVRYIIAIYPAPMTFARQSA